MADRRNRRLDAYVEMSIGGERVRAYVPTSLPPAPPLDALTSAFPYFRIAMPRTRGILREINCAVAQWRPVGSSLSMTMLELDQFAEAFEHEERSAARRRLES